MYEFDVLDGKYIFVYAVNSKPLVNTGELTSCINTHEE